MNGNFDIQSLEKPTNKDLSIIFSPSNNVISYTYQIYKDDILIDSLDVLNNNISKINLNETGTYRINVNLNLINGMHDTI